MSTDADVKMLLSGIKDINRSLSDYHMYVVGKGVYGKQDKEMLLSVLQSSYKEIIRLLEQFQKQKGK